MSPAHPASALPSTLYELTLLIRKVFLLLVLLLAATIYGAPTRGRFTYITTIGSHYVLSPFYGGGEAMEAQRG